MQKRLGTFAAALVCSLLGHGVLLFAMPLLLPPVQTPRLSGAMEVNLRMGAVLHPASAPMSLPEPPEMTAKPPTPSRMPATPPPVKKLTPVPAPPVLSAAGVNPAPPEQRGDGQEIKNIPPMVAAEASAGADGASGQGAIAPAPEGVGDALQDYKFALMGAAGRFKRYPALARARGHEGRVSLLLIWRPGMRAPQVTLQQSAGNGLLDEQGLSMLRQAAAQTPLPPMLFERAFSLPLSVEFSLKDTN